jgi:predicted HicB family RNase H-like nuclease
MHRKDRGNAKLTVDQVLHIRSLKGSKPYKEIAAKFNVRSITIYQIMNRKSWNHI